MIMKRMLALFALAFLFVGQAEAFTYSQVIKTARMNATRAEVANGTIEILHSDGTTVCVTFGLDATAGSVTNSVWTLVLDASTVAATATCVATSARIKDSGGTAEITALTVGTSGSDINLNNTSINSGQNVTLSSVTFTHF